MHRKRRTATGEGRTIVTLITRDGLWLTGVVDGVRVCTAFARHVDRQWLADQLRAERIAQGATVLPGALSSQVSSRNVHVAPSTMPLCLRAIGRIRRWLS